MKTAFTGLVALGMAFGAPAAQGAEDAPAEAESAPEPPPDSEVEPDAVLNLDVEIASAYVWRGANAWGPSTDSQHLSLFPSATLSLGDLSAGYWGAYQLTGQNRGENVDSGVGAEQDLFAQWGLSITENVSLSFILTYYFFPLARSEDAGVSMPMYLEPGVDITTAWVFEAGFGIRYFRGLQGVTDTLSHVYLNPFVSKELELFDTMTLLGALGVGYKVFTHPDAEVSAGNNWDFQADVGVTIALDTFYVLPAVHAAWTDPAEGARAREGLSVWAGLNLGYDFSF